MYFHIRKDMDPLDMDRSILYRCVRDVVELDTTHHTPCHFGSTDVHDIAHMFIQSYDSQNIKFK